MNEDEIEIAAETDARGSTRPTYREVMHEAARAYLQELMTRHNGCVREVAAEADMDRTNCYKVLQARGLMKRRPRSHFTDWQEDFRR